MSSQPAISGRDLARLSGATVDERGVRFEYQGKILRAVRGDHARLLRDLIESPNIDEIFDAGLVRYWTSEVVVEGYDLVVECERVPVVSYPQEWPTTMLHEAGLMIARLGEALARAGLSLHDAHPWNVLFDASRPVWVDWDPSSQEST